MKLAEAADIFIRTAPKLAAMADELKEFDEAQDLLKAHFKATGNTQYARKVGAKLGSRSIFDQAAAKELLGDKAEGCKKRIDTVTLFPIA